jgi:LacI family transcriptional regulator
MRNITIHDVARAAGVSVATVSKALNHTDRLSEETQARVVEIAESLGFVPPRRRAIRKRGQLTIAMVAAEVHGRFNEPLLHGAAETYSPSQAIVLLCDARDDPAQEDVYVRSLIERGVDGIIVAGGGNRPRPSISYLSTVPIVYAFQPSESPDDTSYVHDDRHAGYLAARHFAAIGRTSVAYIPGPGKTRSVDSRRDGLVEGLTAARLRFAGAASYGGWAEAYGQKGIRELLRGPRFDAIMCANDLIARGAIMELAEHHLRVPEDVAVIGVDNFAVIAQERSPTITSVDLRLNEMGREAMLGVVAAIGGAPLPRGLIRRPCRLVPRQSTGAA